MPLQGRLRARPREADVQRVPGGQVPLGGSRRLHDLSAQLQNQQDWFAVLSVPQRTLPPPPGRQTHAVLQTARSPHKPHPPLHRPNQRDPVLERPATSRRRTARHQIPQRHRVPDKVLRLHLQRGLQPLLRNLQRHQAHPHQPGTRNNVHRPDSLPARRILPARAGIRVRQSRRRRLRQHQLQQPLPPRDGTTQCPLLVRPGRHQDRVRGDHVHDRVRDPQHRVQRQSHLDHQQGGRPRLG
uniref:(northern house mosquito) hypothetical protein n=1 Tax=Culex pipiens TaxID=7175 RepID=A0A8D8N4K4_CULPI